MKKILCVLLAVLCLVPLWGCGGVNKVEKLIDEIGIVNENCLDSEEKLIQAELAYEKLSEKNKEKVDNYVDLVNARICYNYWFCHVVAYSDTVDTIKASLLNPSSLIVNSTEIYIGYSVDDKTTPIAAKVDIDYSAQNMAGGYTRKTKTYYFSYLSESRVAVPIGIDYYLDIVDRAFKDVEALLQYLRIHL